MHPNAYDFVEVIPATDGWLPVVKSANGLDEEIVDHLCETRGEAEKAGREFRALIIQGRHEDRCERAIEEGRLAGGDTYNEFMGYV